jgi:hypothetical protein
LLAGMEDSWDSAVGLFHFLLFWCGVRLGTWLIDN